MKALKIVGVILGAIVLLAALLVGLAFVPAVQTWAVRKAVAKQPGLTLEFGRVTVGPSSAEIRDLRFAQDGLVVSARRMLVRFSAWDYYKFKRVNVDGLEVEGLVVNTRQMPVTVTTTTRPPPAAPVGATPTPRAPVFAGIFHLAQLPLDVRLDELAVDGRMLLAGDRVVDFTLKGGGIELGRRGNLAWKVDFSDRTKGAPLRALHANGTMGLHIAPDRRIDRIELENTVAAEGPKLPADPVRIQLTAEQVAPDANEIYTAHFALVRDGKAEPVFNTRTEYVAAAHRLDGTWDLAVRSAQFAAVLADLGLPEVEAVGAGKFSVQPDLPSALGSGELRLGLTKLEKLGPQFAAVGSLQLQAVFDGAYADNVARLNQLDVDLATADAHKLVEIVTRQPVSYDTASRRLALTMPGSELARITLQHIPLAWAQPVVKAPTIESGELSADFSITAEADGSQAHLRAIQPLTFGGVTLRDGGKRLVDQANLTLSPSIDYSPVKIAAQIPDLKLAIPAGDSASGSVSVEVTNFATSPAVAFSVQFQERIVSLLKPYLSFNPPPLTVDSAAEGRIEGQKLQLTKFSAVLSHGRGLLVAAVEILQPLTADFSTEFVVPANVLAPAARLRVCELPLILAQAFRPKSGFSGMLKAVTLDVMLPVPDKIIVQTPNPISLRGVSVALDGQALAKGLDFDLDFAATRHGEEVSGELRNFEVRQGSSVLVNLTATGGTVPGPKFAATGKGRLKADVAAILKQPLLAGFGVLSRGNLTADFDVNAGESLLVKAGATLRNLVASQGDQPLGDIDLTVDSTLKPDGSGGTVKIPLTLTAGGRSSDLTLEGGFARTAANVSFTGRLGSKLLVADDLQALAALAPQSPAANPPAVAPAGGTQTASRPAVGQGGTVASLAANPGGVTAPAAAVAARDTQPFWKGVSGRLDADLKLVKYGRDYTISDIHGAAVVDDTHVALENLEGKFKDNAFKITVGVDFAAKAPQPYTLSGLVKVPGFDVGAFLRATNPNEAPAIETKVAINAKLGGQGATEADLVQNAIGQIDVTGSKGVLRALGKKGETAGTASSLIGLLGAATGSSGTVALGQFTGELKEMPFDHFSMHLERGADLNLKLTSLEFISPVTRITGNGSIQHQKGVEMPNQPLHLEVQLAGKDHMATLLGSLNLLGDQQDDKGYTLMNSPFVIGGTLANPDSSQLWKIVGSAAAKAVVPSLQSLQGLFH